MEYSRINCFRRMVAANFRLSTLLQAVALIVLSSQGALGQGGGSNTLYGDLKVDESKVSGLKPMNFEVILTGRNRSEIGHQTVAKNGRYRFENLTNGTYYVSVRMDNSEVANVRVTLLNGSGTDNRIGGDYRQDIALEWRPNPSTKNEKGTVVAPMKHYERTPPNDSLFEKAENSINEK